LFNAAELFCPGCESAYEKSLFRLPTFNPPSAFAFSLALHQKLIAFLLRPRRIFTSSGTRFAYLVDIIQEIRNLVPDGRAVHLRFWRSLIHILARNDLLLG
jgi:hypothetical protein